jgi:hypothetical protein
MVFGKRVSEFAVAEQAIVAARLEAVSTRGRTEATVYEHWAVASEDPERKRPGKKRR